MRSEERWQVCRKKPTEQERNGKFVTVWIPGRFEPNGGTVRFEANQTERWTGVELAESPIHTEAQRTELVLRPGEELPEPAGSGEWPAFRIGGVQVQFDKRLRDCVSILDRMCTGTRQRSPGDPTHSFRSTVILRERFKNAIAPPAHIVVGIEKGWGEQVIGTNPKLSVQLSRQLQGEPFGGKRFYARQSPAGLVGPEENLRAMTPDDDQPERSWFGLVKGLHWLIASEYVFIWTRLNHWP